MLARTPSASRPTEVHIRAAHGSGARARRPVDAERAPPLAQRALRAAARKLRVLSWAPSYSRADLIGDVSGGLTVAVLLVPQAIAYSLLVEVPPTMGLYSSFVPLATFALFTSSRHLSIGPFAPACLVIASAVEGLVPPEHTEGEWVRAVLALTFVTGLLQVLMGILRLGIVASFLAAPIVDGFTVAVALIIMASQLKYMLGVPIARGTMPETVARAVALVAHGECNWWAVGATSMAYTFMAALREGGRRCCRPGTPVFEQLIVVVLFTAVQRACALPLDTIGELPRGLPAPSAPWLPAEEDEWRQFARAGLVVAFTSFLLTMSVARAFAAKHAYAISANQELLALGLANVAGSFFGAFPISGSLSRSAVGAAAGVRTPLHGALQAIVVALVLLWITPLFRTLPFAALAAIIFAALRSLVDFRAAVRLWRSSRTDFALWAVAFGATAAFDVEAGLVAAVGSSLGLLVLQTSRPRWAVLGRLPGTDVFRDVTRYPSARAPPHALILRFDAPLHFANANFFAKALRGQLRAMRRARGSPPTHVVLDCSAMHNLDASADAILRQLLEELRADGIAVLLASPRARFRDALRRFGTLDALVGERNIFPILLDAVEVGCARAPEPPPADTARTAPLPSSLSLARSRARAANRSYSSHRALERADSSDDDESENSEDSSGASDEAAPRCTVRARADDDDEVNDDGFDTASELGSAEPGGTAGAGASHRRALAKAPEALHDMSV
ncbi:hypothetical protein KFE25_006233 [Diacronema lutheri]|uniref:STAS domain-containing protein n=1 Tax=Diacronema lutheri TaxID=2081491 RepID=A0A8J6CJC6_DIALT|nr:hypothetical protein KFE25_006233 [Diacronema lutheri]